MGWQRSGTQGELGTLGIEGAGVFGDSRAGDTPVPSACAIRALLLEVLPILGPPSSLTRIMLSRDELLCKILELLQLLPLTLLGLQVGTLGGLSSPTLLGLQVGTWVTCHPFSCVPSPASLLTATASTSWTSSSLGGCWRRRRWVTPQDLS